MQRLIGTNDQELAKQVIYFANPDQLNDPMEGHSEVYWRGDGIAWRNLLRHYLMCLDRTCQLSLLSDKDHLLSPKSIPIHISADDDTYTPASKRIIEEIWNRFFGSEYVTPFINSLLRRTTPIRLNELTIYLRSIHPLAHEATLSTYESFNLIPLRSQKKSQPDSILKHLLSSNYLESMEQVIKESGEETAIVLLEIQENMHKQGSILFRYNNPNQIPDDALLILEDFPEIYARRLEEITYPEWYTACFMTSCENSSVWGSYGTNHAGACLIFDSEEYESEHYLSLRGINGWGEGGAIYGKIKLKFEPIDYEQNFGEIDFFRSLGRLSITALNSTWHYLDGQRSSCAKEITTSMEQWRETYWNNFYRGIRIKSPDWRYEKEHRLILCDMLGSHSTEDSRALTYEFSSLKGIIFGIKTTIEDKLEIMRIIDEKCTAHGRTDFKFYQAYYSHEHKCIKHQELSLLKYSAPENRSPER